MELCDYCKKTLCEKNMELIKEDIVTYVVLIMRKIQIRYKGIINRYIISKYKRITK